MLNKQHQRTLTRRALTLRHPIQTQTNSQTTKNKFPVLQSKGRRDWFITLKTKTKTKPPSYAATARNLANEKFATRPSSDAEPVAQQIQIGSKSNANSNSGVDSESNEPINEIVVYTIGRREDCSLVLTDPHISSQHLQIVCHYQYKCNNCHVASSDGIVCKVKDQEKLKLKKDDWDGDENENDGKQKEREVRKMWFEVVDTSTNGTYLNGIRLERNKPTILFPGAEITLPTSTSAATLAFGNGGNDVKERIEKLAMDYTFVLNLNNKEREVEDGKENSNEIIEVRKVEAESNAASDEEDGTAKLKSGKEVQNEKNDEMTLGGLDLKHDEDVELKEFDGEAIEKTFDLEKEIKLKLSTIDSARDDVNNIDMDKDKLGTSSPLSSLERKANLASKFVKFKYNTVGGMYEKSDLRKQIAMSGVNLKNYSDQLENLERLQIENKENEVGAENLRTRRKIAGKKLLGQGVNMKDKKFKTYGSGLSTQSNKSNLSGASGKGYCSSTLQNELISNSSSLAGSVYRLNDVLKTCVKNVDKQKESVQEEIDKALIIKESELDEIIQCYQSENNDLKWMLSEMYDEIQDAIKSRQANKFDLEKWKEALEHLNPMEQNETEV